MMSRTNTNTSNTIPYDHEFICTYQMLSDDEADLADDLYRVQLVQAFGLTSYDDDVFGRTMRSLYDAYGKGTELEGVIQRNRRNCFLGGDDPYEAFVMLFAYPTFHTLHACIGSLIRGSVHKDTMLWEKLHAAI
jgi:hypothetical protein